MNIKHKIITAFTLAVFLVPGMSFAQTASVAQLQAEIQSLTAQLQSLEAQLATVEGATPPAWCYTFNNNLSVGMSGNAVTELQTALQMNGESVQVNGTFDDQTASAVTGFQEKYQSTVLSPNGLSNGTGYAGRSTRAELNALFGCGAPTPISTSTLPVACSMLVPYCPYGSYAIKGSDGCEEIVCNSASGTSTVPAPLPSPNPITSSTIYSLFSLTAVINQPFGATFVIGSMESMDCSYGSSASGNSDGSVASCSATSTAPSYTFTSSGTLPPGLSLTKMVPTVLAGCLRDNIANSVQAPCPTSIALPSNEVGITGTATQLGSYPITIIATNANGVSVSQGFTITVAATEPATPTSSIPVVYPAGY